MLTSFSTQLLQLLLSKFLVTETNIFTSISHSFCITLYAKTLFPPAFFSYFKPSFPSIISIIYLIFISFSYPFPILLFVYLRYTVFLPFIILYYLSPTVFSEMFPSGCSGKYSTVSIHYSRILMSIDLLGDVTFQSQGAASSKLQNLLQSMCNNHKSYRAEVRRGDEQSCRSKSEVTAQQ